MRAMRNIRWVVTWIKKGQDFRTMIGACQGQYTFGTHKEAKQNLEELADSIRRSYGPDVYNTLEVRPADCWPNHNDPKHAVFTDEHAIELMKEHCQELEEFRAHIRKYVTAE